MQARPSGSSVDKAHDFWCEGRGLDPSYGPLLPTRWVGDSIMAETEVMVSPLYLRV